MKRIAKFEKVSKGNFTKYWYDIVKKNLSIKYGVPECKISEKEIIETINEIYDNIKLPKRATSGSAGYDFFAPCDLEIPPHSVIEIPTGIRVKIDEGWVLKEYPRSGHGFKYGIHMANTVGIIDSDYYYSDNEGHIFIKLVNNDSILSKNISVKQGDGFCQGIFAEYGITYDDNVTEVRNGGFGSTTKTTEK